MLSNPLVLSFVIVVAAAWVGGAILMLLNLRSARPGFEDENGFHFLDELDELVVPADDVPPHWFTGSLAERYMSQRAVIFAGVPA